MVYSSTHLSGPQPPARPDRSKGYVWPFFREFELFLREKDGTLKWFLEVPAGEARKVHVEYTVRYPDDYAGEG